MLILRSIIVAGLNPYAKRKRFAVLVLKPIQTNDIHDIGSGRVIG